jgi:hypothetical protein
MLNITDDAMEMCHATIIQLSNGHSHSRCLRFKQEPHERLALTFDEPKDGDEIITHQGVTVFAVPERFVEFCSDKTLDIDEHGKLTLG